MNPADLSTIFNLDAIAYIKVALLILIGIYAIFTLMLSTKIRSLNKTVFLPRESGEIIIRFVAILYFFIVLSLFIATLVIV